MLNILNYSLLSRISSGGILGQSRLFILLIYSLFSFTISVIFTFFVVVVLVSTVRAVLYPVERKGSIMYQVPGWVSCAAGRVPS